jgi:hypothetical protein
MVNELPGELMMLLQGLFWDSEVIGNGFIAANTQFDPPTTDVGASCSVFVVL